MGMNTQLADYIRVYDGDLAADLCDQLVAAFGSLSHLRKPNGRGHRAGLEESAWTELTITRIADAALLAKLRQKITFGLGRYNRDTALSIPIPNSAKLDELTIKRYQPGRDENFQLHFDSLNERSNRYLVLLWYLNEVAEGGETEFPGLGIKVAAKRGRLLMFPPYWMFQHAGLPPISGDKYILSTYLLF
jgi:prolyl 4-hydroxylase